MRSSFQTCTRHYSPMPTKQDRVTDRVIHLLSAFSQVPDSQIVPTDDLEYDLGIYKSEFTAMAKPLTRITKAEGGRRITRPECSAFTTVKSVLDLAIHKL